MYLFCVRGNFEKGKIGELNLSVYRRCTVGAGGVVASTVVFAFSPSSTFFGDFLVFLAVTVPVAEPVANFSSSFLVARFLGDTGSSLVFLLSLSAFKSFFLSVFLAKCAYGYLKRLDAPLPVCSNLLASIPANNYRIINAFPYCTFGRMKPAYLDCTRDAAPLRFAAFRYVLAAKE